MADPQLTPIDALLESWELAMRARNLADTTVRSYLDSARKLNAHADVADVDEYTTTQIRAYLADLAATRKPATVSFRFRALQQWFAWLAAEDELTVNPIARVDAPLVPEQPVPVLTPDDLRAILKTCDGKEFADRRDAAILLLFLDGGIRLDEMAGIHVADIDLRGQQVTVLGKGRRERSVPFGVKTAQAIDRYVRMRARHRLATVDPKLWLGAKGKGGLTGNGIYQLVKRRADEAGIALYPHMFRHTFAHEWLDHGGNEGDLMQLAGWRSRSMLQRYGHSAAAGRARRAHRSNSLGDRL